MSEQPYTWSLHAAGGDATEFRTLPSRQLWRVEQDVAKWYDRYTTKFVKSNIFVDTIKYMVVLPSDQKAPSGYFSVRGESHHAHFIRRVVASFRPRRTRDNIPGRRPWPRPDHDRPDSRRRSRSAGCRHCRRHRDGDRHAAQYFAHHRQ